MAPEPEPSRRDRLLTPAFIALSVADLAYFTANGVVFFALPLYVVGPIGSDAAGAGIAFGAFGITALVCRPFAGRLTDTVGRRPLLLGGALLSALGMALLPHAHVLAVVIALRLLQGVAEAAFFVAGFAALLDLAPPARVGEALSYNSLGLYLGLALGPPLGELLLRRGGYPTAWYGAAGLGVLAAVVVVGVGETRSGDVADGGHGQLIHRPAVPIAVGFLASLAAVGGFLAFASLHAVAVGLSDPSLALLVYGAVVVACRLLFAKVPDRLPSLPLGAAALLVTAAGLAIMAMWRTPGGLFVGVIGVAVGVTFSTPAFFSAIFASARPSERGAASGTASASMDIGLGFGPITLGLVADSFGIPWAFGAGAGIALAGAAWTISLYRRQPPRQPDGSTPIP
jgi:predicted MFS family arabinose efflux permease